MTAPRRYWLPIALLPFNYMRHLFRDTATISRSVVTGNKTSYVEATSIPCHIQPVSDSYAQGAMGRDSKDFRMFSTGEVRIGDRIVDQNGTKYEVYGTKFHQFRSRQHYEASLRAA